MTKPFKWDVVISSAQSVIKAMLSMQRVVARHA